MGMGMINRFSSDAKWMVVCTFTGHVEEMETEAEAREFIRQWHWECQANRSISCVVMKDCGRQLAWIARVGFRKIIWKGPQSYRMDRIDVLTPHGMFFVFPSEQAA